jgi:hypothetical protein
LAFAVYLLYSKFVVHMRTRHLRDGRYVRLSRRLVFQNSNPLTGAPNPYPVVIPWAIRVPNFDRTNIIYRTQRTTEAVALYTVFANKPLYSYRTYILYNVIKICWVVIEFIFYSRYTSCVYTSITITAVAWCVEVLSFRSHEYYS